jgi:hypothetical protein
MYGELQVSSAVARTAATRARNRNSVRRFMRCCLAMRGQFVLRDQR